MRDGYPPETIIQVLDCFAPLFSRRCWPWATVLVVGAILAPGKRTVVACLRAMGLSDEVHFQNYHRLLNRAVWSSRQVGRILLQLLLEAFVAPDAAVVLGIDETVERRWGSKIAARGIYRDAVQSSKGCFVKTSGLRWLSLMLLAPITWIGRVWAWPFLTVLAPSEGYHELRHERHKKLTGWARQMILRTTSALLGLFPLATLLVHRLLQGKDLPTRQVAWYQKATPSFSGALAFLRGQLWPTRLIWRSSVQTDIVESLRGLFDCLTDMLAYAT